MSVKQMQDAYRQFHKELSQFVEKLPDYFRDTSAKSKLVNVRVLPQILTPDDRSFNDNDLGLADVNFILIVEILQSMFDTPGIKELVVPDATDWVNQRHEDIHRLMLEVGRAMGRERIGRASRRDQGNRPEILSSGVGGNNQMKQRTSNYDNDYKILVLLQGLREAKNNVRSTKR